MERLFPGFTADSFSFFIMIRLNNNKAFFEENRAQYETCLKAPLYALAADLEPTLHAIDPAIETRPQKAVARIRRSTRYTRDKSPYRDHLWIGWRDRSRQESMGTVFGFYFDMSFTDMNCGGGYYAASPAEMAALRAKIALQPERFAQIVQAAEDAGFVLFGEDYKKIPAPQDLPEICKKYYVKKTFYVEKPLPLDERHMSPALVDVLIRAFETLAPLYAFINQA